MLPMSEEPRAATGETSAWHAEVELSPFWWLWLPLAVALFLAVTAHVAPAFYAVWINREDRGLLEFSHVVISLAGFVWALRILALLRLRQRPWLYAWVGLAALGCLFIAGEEASWGQHYVGWSTPESWQAINDQGETNLHNISSWFDQKPRLLLEVGVIVGGILLPLAALLRPTLRSARLSLIIPPLICLPSALLAELSRLSQRLLQLGDGEFRLFTRSSEVQELYFYLFVLLYLVVLRRRLLQD
jgi:hypothetical protein